MKGGSVVSGFGKAVQILGIVATFTVALCKVAEAGIDSAAKIKSIRDKAET